MNSKRLLYIVVLGLLVASPAYSQVCTGAESEGWDQGALNGWGGFSGTSVFVETSGGNPEGYLSADNIGQVGILTSAAPWIGDWPDDIRELVVDIQVFGTGNGGEGPSIRVRRNASTNGWYYELGSLIPLDGQWHQTALPLNPLWTDLEAEANGWQLIPGTGEYSWAEVMASLGYLIVLVNGVADDEWIGIDNISRDCGLFSDNFESGDTGAWSLAAP